MISHIQSECFVFALTGEMPTHFIDEKGRYPHQRVNLKNLVSPINDNQYALLLRLFDQGFQPLLNSRFQSIDHLKGTFKWNKRVRKSRI